MVSPWADPSGREIVMFTKSSPRPAPPCCSRPHRGGGHARRRLARRQPGRHGDTAQCDVERPPDRREGRHPLRDHLDLHGAGAHRPLGVHRAEANSRAKVGFWAGLGGYASLLSLIGLAPGCRSCRTGGYLLLSPTACPRSRPTPGTRSSARRAAGVPTGEPAHQRPG